MVTPSSNKTLIDWVIAGTTGASSSGFTNGSAEFGSYEACFAARRYVSSSTGMGHHWQWNCVPYESEPRQTSLTEKQNREAR
jgi:hypothetical protein